MRLTLDLDNTKLSKTEGKAILLKITFPRSFVRYRLSSKGRGGHVEMFADISEEESYNIRRIMGDHDMRIHYDLMRGKRDNPMFPTQVLFDFKIVDGKIMRASEWIKVS